MMTQVEMMTMILALQKNMMYVVKLFLLMTVCLWGGLK